jgi:TPR repeat protein
MHWLSLAAEQGYAPAEYELGRTYLYGRGIPADYGKAIFWEEKAAQQGVAKAQRDMAFIYERGLGVAADNAVAARWNRKAAERGDPDGQLHLAQALEAANVLEAKIWYLKAARQNVAPAQLQLGRIYARQGRSSCSPALRWYKKAAGSGQAPAMYELGKLYENTCGPDLDKAFIWFRIGARFGSAESQAEADKLLPRLNKVKNRQADGAVERWISKHTRTEKEAEDE